jgi:putative membrane protein
MIKDHTKTSSELKAQAEQLNVPVPATMTSSRRTMLDKLKSLDDKDFMKQYLDDQVSAYKNAVSLFERYGKGGDDNELKGWATQTLPTPQHHLDMAQQLAK